MEKTQNHGHPSWRLRHLEAANLYSVIGTLISRRKCQLLGVAEKSVNYKAAITKVSTVHLTGSMCKSASD